LTTFWRRNGHRATNSRVDHRSQRDRVMVELLPWPQLSGAGIPGYPFLHDKVDPAAM